MGLTDGAVKGIDLVNMLCSGLQSVGLFAGQQEEGGAETKFAEMRATANINRGVIDNRDLEAKSPLIRVGGAGTADLVLDQVDYLASAKLVGTCQGQGGLGIQDLSGFDIPVRITGRLSSPTIEPDYTAILQQGLTKGLGEEIQKKIGIPVPGTSGAEQGQGSGGLETILPGILFPESQQQQPQPSSEEQSSGEQQQPQQQPQQQQQPEEQKPEDVLKDALEGLFQ